MSIAQWNGDVWRPARKVCLSGGLLLGGLLSGGCRHRQAPPTLPAVLKSPDVQPPSPAAPAMEGTPPAGLTAAPPSVKVTEATPPKRARRSSQKRGAAAPVESAAVPAATPVSPVGALTTGGEVTPKAQQEVSELIGSGERRLETVGGGKAREQQPGQLKEIRRFLDQAKEAMGMGDSEGAKTLATKAKLLLDDLEKWAEK